MGELVGINAYPLTGARGIELDEAVMERGGVPEDRTYLLYNGAELSRVHAHYLGEYPRVSQRQYPQLARLHAVYDSKHNLHVGLDEDQPELSVSSHKGSSSTRVDIEAFGDQIPAFDVGDEAAEFFQNYLGASGVRLARVAQNWKRAPYDRVDQRANAPLHIVSNDSVKAAREHYEQKFGETPLFDAGRFRPNLVVEGFEEPFSEKDWQERDLKIGNLTIRVTRLTARCPVPGYDQETGENMKDLPKVYPQFPKVSGQTGKPTFGVYGYPVMYKRMQQRKRTISLGDQVELVDPLT